jgi:hypothetical protein
MRAPFVSLVHRGLSVAVRGQELRQRRHHLLGSLLGNPVAGASDDRVQADFTGVDVAAGERVGEPRREVRRAGDVAWPSGVDSGAEDALMTISFHSTVS